MQKIVTDWAGKSRRLNWKPSLPNHRELKYSHIEQMSSPVVLPSSVDLRPLCSPVRDQGQWGSCSSFASGAAVEFLQLQELRLKVPEGQDPQVYVEGQFMPVSEFFIYYGERKIEGTTGSDAGATTLADAGRVLVNEGVCRLSTWPYSDQNIFVAPSQAAYAEALKHKLTAFYALEGLAELKRCLANGFPFICGIPVCTSFMSASVASSGVIPYPSDSDSVEGGHAVCIVGYDDSKQCFILRNSWGTDWGMQGYAWIPYSYINDLADDEYTFRRQPTTAP